jgi:hypothetical protein
MRLGTKRGKGAPYRRVAARSSLPLDSQTVELLGRNRLVTELLLAGLEVAFPARDRGVDLIGYADLSAKVRLFSAVPIQMKAASKRSFGVDRKYAKISNLVLAHVWNLGTPKLAVTYALTYPDALKIAKKMNWTRTISWKGGGYGTTNPSRRLVALLEPYRMTPAKWWQCVTGQSSSPRGRQGADGLVGSTRAPGR